MNQAWHDKLKELSKGYAYYEDCLRCISEVRENMLKGCDHKMPDGTLAKFESKLIKDRFYCGLCGEDFTPEQLDELYGTDPAATDPW